MVVFKSFQATLFNQNIVGNIGDVLCPPYDQINDEVMRQKYYKLSPYNSVRLEAARKWTSDTSLKNQNTRSACTFNAWISSGVLKLENYPAFYIVEHQFEFLGQPHIVQGILGRLQLEEYKSGSVIPHEYTSQKIKEERLNLLKSCSANFSPILCMYDDNRGVIDELVENITEEKESFAINHTKDSFKIWKINDLSFIHLIQSQLSTESLFIVDGHHRYESSLLYQEFLRGNSKSNTVNANYIMSFLFSSQQKGLTILPYHRLVSGINDSQKEAIMKKYYDLFSVDTSPKDETETINLYYKNDQGDFKILRSSFSNKKLKEDFITDSHIIDKVLLEPILGDDLENNIMWTHDIKSLKRLVKTGQADIGFELNPVSQEIFRSTARKGDKMPPKSTYFYPKLPTGITFYKL